MSIEILHEYAQYLDFLIKNGQMLHPLSLTEMNVVMEYDKWLDEIAKKVLKTFAEQILKELSEEDSTLSRELVVIELDFLADVRRILEELRSTAEMCGVATVADCYDLAGKEYNYQDHNYGWDLYDLKKVKIIPIVERGKWKISLPKPKYLSEV